MGEKGCTVPELSDFLQALEHTEVLQLLNPPGRSPHYFRTVLQKCMESTLEISFFDQVNYVFYFRKI